MEICRLELTMKTINEIDLPPFAGSTIRGGFGNILKEICCIRPNGRCNDCMLRRHCAYTYIFESGWYFAEGDRQRSGVPQPFVLEPPVTTKREISDNEIHLGLLLFGEGINYLPYFITCFEKLGQRGLGKNRAVYRLNRVFDVFGSVELWDSSSGEIIKRPHTRTWKVYLKSASENGKVKRCEIHLVTPLRVKQEGRLQDQLNFDLLLRAIVRRWRLLCKYYASESANIDMDELFSLAQHVQSGTLNLRWKERERYSRRQDQRMMLGGMLGMMECEGDMEPFLPWLLLGQDLHVGKNSSFGLGKYILKCKK